MDLDLLCAEAFDARAQTRLCAAVEHPHRTNVGIGRSEQAGHGGRKDTPQSLIVAVQRKERVVWVGAEDVLLTKEEQVAIVKKLSSLFEELAPAIPLYPNPVWGTYSTKRFRGFPSNSNPYAALSPNKEPECLLVLTELEPVGER